MEFIHSWTDLIVVVGMSVAGLIFWFDHKHYHHHHK